MSNAPRRGFVRPALACSLTPLLRWSLCSLLTLPVMTPVARGQTSSERLAQLRERARKEGWTFSVGPTAASERPIDQLCGLVGPGAGVSRGGTLLPAEPGIRDDAELNGSQGYPPLGLPAKFDWHEQGGCPPVRDQGNCGACWAFSTVGPLECAVLIHDGTAVDLSEQWLISCNRDGFGCSGGWFAFDYFKSKTDPCGGTGAVLESDFPYRQSDVPCQCPYPHQYTIDSWAFVAGEDSIPSIAAIKLAIMEHGPVAAAVHVSDAFTHYTGGVFNAQSSETVNHGIVLVGWDDAQGSQGVWILRNSWGSNWGEKGYMWIEYGCASVGYAAGYVDYSGAQGPRLQVTPTSLNLGNVAVGQSAAQTFTVRNIGVETLDGTASGLSLPFSFEGSTAYQLAAGQSQTITVRFAPGMQGTFVGAVSFSGGGGATAAVQGTGIGAGPSDICTGAPTVGSGTFTGSNVGAGTDASPSCGGTADVWWRFTALKTGVVTVDTCGSDFDTVLTVHTACGGAEVTCNDDSVECPTNLRASRVMFPATAGSIYYVRVAGNNPPTGNIVLNITADIPKHTLSGRVTGPDGTGVGGVTITGLPGTPATDADGYYSAQVDYGFIGTATPRKTAYTFSPVSHAYINVTVDLGNQNYHATPPDFTISGRVRDENGNTLSGVAIIGLPGTPMTDAAGQYDAVVPFGFSGAGMPSMAGRTFEPPSRAYQQVTNDLLFEDYVGYLQTGSLQVVLEPAAARDAGARWQVGGGEWRASGDTVPGLPVGRHTVSYQAIPGWVAPQSEQATVDPDQTTQLSRTYTPASYAVTLGIEPSGAGTITADPAADEFGRYVYGTRVNLTAAPKPGYRVRAWRGADDVPATGQETNAVTVTSSRTVIVEFELKPFTMYQLAASVAGGEGAIEPTQGAYPEGTEVVLLATPADGYEVKSWTGTDDDTTAATTNVVTMNGNRTASVTFERWPDCNGNHVPDPEDIAAGTSADANGNGIPDECEQASNGSGPGDSAGGDATNGTGGSADPAAPPPVIHAPSAGGLCGFGIAEMAVLTIAGVSLLRCRRAAIVRSVRPPSPTGESTRRRAQRLGAAIRGASRKAE